ncbi:auxin-induced protein 6B-like [Senna tora]|uniref:Auxin-induced protein 6B-like n=1 Tax=Senna tora TaxID=362788 RepID=A0A834WX32_9FABA|nr:auxin-induced protein 6B-like [Senna tora]
MYEEKKMKVKKGWLAVQVGLADDGADSDSSQKFLIPISYLYHPLFTRLLERAHDVYGYHTDGPLKLPCSVDDFLHLRNKKEILGFLPSIDALCFRIGRMLPIQAVEVSFSLVSSVSISSFVSIRITNKLLHNFHFFFFRISLLLLLEP